MTFWTEESNSLLNISLFLFGQPPPPPPPLLSLKIADPPVSYKVKTIQKKATPTLPIPSQNTYY